MPSFHPSRTPAAALSAAVLAAAGACGGATAPVPGAEAGRYVATTLAGRPLPALADSSAREFGVLVADTLELDGRGGARRSFAFRRVYATPASDVVYRNAAAVSYRVAASGRLEVGYFGPCNDTAICMANDTGSLGAGRLVLTSYRTGGGRALVLERVGP